MKKDNLGCDEVVLPVEVFNQYGTAQKYVEALRAENVTLSESVTSQALLIANRKQVLLEAVEKLNTPLSGNEPAGFAWTRRHILGELRRMALEPTGVDKGEG
jgi:hypothetical protein